MSYGKYNIRETHQIYHTEIKYPDLNGNPRTVFILNFSYKNEKSDLTN